MSDLLSEERRVYTEIWSGVESYGAHSPGEHLIPIFECCVADQVAVESGNTVVWSPKDLTVLDAGTGSGKGALALAAAGFDVTTCDVTNAGLPPEFPLPYHDACLWRDLSPLARGVGHPGRTKFDYVYSCDVLEHIPPQFTMLAIDQMLRIARRGLFLSISLVPDNFGAWVGEPLHKTIMPFQWWKDSIAELGEIVEARDLLESAVFFVRAQ